MGPWDSDGDAWRAPLHTALSGILACFPAVSKLILKCDRHPESIADPLGSALRRLKLCSLCLVAALGTSLHKLSASSCIFGAKGIEGVLRACLHLEEQCRQLARLVELEEKRKGRVVRLIVCTRHESTNVSMGRLTLLPALLFSSLSLYPAVGTR
uniref:Uncharacterized protein n=1 Tax=Oryza sativa subsp. japonica TaxID=39947 RepID=Q8L677_ORYSJ|nr:hypothetical protein [Oryza sativa Japonica Group]